MPSSHRLYLFTLITTFTVLLLPVIQTLAADAGVQLDPYASTTNPTIQIDPLAYTTTSEGMIPHVLPATFDEEVFPPSLMNADPPPSDPDPEKAARGPLPEKEKAPPHTFSMLTHPPVAAVQPESPEALAMKGLAPSIMPELHNIYAEQGIAPDGMTKLVKPKPQEPELADTCTNRYLLYSVQVGEGFSLRRDALARMSVALLQSKYNATWTLVLPPLSSRLSPHWGQGIQHDGLKFQERPIPWRELFDLDQVTASLKLKFIEYSDFLQLQASTGVQATQIQLPSVNSNQEPPGALVDQMIHLCSFHYTPEFFKRQHEAREADKLFPGTHYPFDMMFKEFDCSGGKKPSEEGFCPNQPNPIALKSIAGSYDSTALFEYGPIRFKHPSKDSFHCGLSNMSPNFAPFVLDEYLSPKKTAADGSPMCTISVSNSQLIFWPGRPHPQAMDPSDPAVLTHRIRDEFLRAARLPKNLRELAQLFLTRVIQGRPAIVEGPHVSIALPYYLSFHVRRGDFKYVHKDVVPDFASLARQMRDKYLRVTGHPKHKDHSISTRLFVSSDMPNDEWQQLVAEVKAQDAQAPKQLNLQIVRFDITEVLSSPSLASHFSQDLKNYLASAKSATATDEYGRLVTTPAVPITPFHILLIDSYLCEQSLPIDGFLATKHSYVSEMIWNVRKAWNIEDQTRWEKESFEGVAAQPEPTPTQPVLPTTPPLPPATPEKKVKDEL